MKYERQISSRDESLPQRDARDDACEEMVQSPTPVAESFDECVRRLQRQRKLRFVRVCKDGVPRQFTQSGREANYTNVYDAELYELISFIK